MEILYHNRREIIDRVQELLGPVVPRPLAEQTFNLLLSKKLIVETENGYHADPLLDSEVARENAKISMANSSDGQMRHFSVNRRHMIKARVGQAWKALAQQASIFSPTLLQSEGFHAPTDETDDSEKF